MRKRALPPSGDVGWRICRRRENQTRSGWNSTRPSSAPYLHLAMSAGGYVAVEKTKPGRDGIRQGPHPRSPMIVGTVGISWRGSDFAPNPGLLSRPSNTVVHSIHLNAKTCLSSIWRCRLADMSPSKEPIPVEVEIDGAFIRDHHRNGIA